MLPVSIPFPPRTPPPPPLPSTSGSLRLARAPPVSYMIRRRRRQAPHAAPTDEVGSSDAVASSTGDKRVGTDLSTLLRRFWKVAAPYWFSEDKVQARLRLAAVFALTLGTTGISVGFNFLGRDFYNALTNKDQEQFTRQLLYYLGGFAGGIPFFVLRDYARETLSLRWRSWMTSFYMRRYFDNQTFYKIQSQSIIDNPDQRIVDDLSSFTGTALAFSLTLFNAAVDLISFSNILYGIYPPLFIVLLTYSLGGTALSVFLGKGLVNLNFMQEKKEADFRYGLVRVRENSESIAFYGGEENELQLLLGRFKRAFENLSDLLIASRNLDFFTNGYRYLIQILPAAVVAPMYFSGKIEFGVINQSVSAFNHILSDFSLIVYQFQAISAFSAVIDRLGEFDDLLDGNQPSVTLQHENMDGIRVVLKDDREITAVSSNGPIALRDEGHVVLEIQNMTLLTPRTGNILITDLSLEISEKDHLLVMGPSGSGKTSFLRALAGLWTSGTGNIVYHVRESVDSFSTAGEKLANREDHGRLLTSSKQRRASGIFFLPQRPYMVLGTLRQQLLYPTWSRGTHDPPSENNSDSLPFLSQGEGTSPAASNLDTELKLPTTNDLTRVLEEVQLGDLASRFNGLDSLQEWSSVLSLGEQQRLAFARLLLARPKLVLLDESTSALDEKNEAHLYKTIESAGITYISIGHRSTLRKFHKKALHIMKPKSSVSSSLRNWRLESISQNASFEQGASPSSASSL